MDALKSKKRFMQEIAFKQKRGEPRLKFNPWLTLLGLRTTGLWSINEIPWVANKNAGFVSSCPFEVTVGHFLSLAWK